MMIVRLSPGGICSLEGSFFLFLKRGGLHFSILGLPKKRPEKTRLQICPLYIFGNKPPQMVPIDQTIGFQGLALIQGQISNHDYMVVSKVFHFHSYLGKESNLTG